MAFRAGDSLEVVLCDTAHVLLQLRPITAVTDQLLLNKNVSGRNTKYI